jgi:propanol-preferring alcohol dehydrogenase
VDAVLDFVGTDRTIAAGLATLRPGGAYGLVGSAGGALHRAWFGALPRDGEVFTFQGATVAEAREVLDLAGKGLLRNEIEPVPFDRIEDAYARLAAGTLAGRAVIRLD